MKNKLLLATFICTFLSATMFSQENGKLEKMFKADFNFAGIGVAYELPLSKKWSVDLSTGIGAAANAVNSYEVKWNLAKSPAAYFKSEFKYNYNIEKRFKKGKNTINNSSNYWGIQTKYITPKFNEDDYAVVDHNVLATEFHWGLQRSLGGNWLFNFHVGLGYAVDFDLGENDTSSNLYPALGLKFSYKIF